MADLVQNQQAVEERWPFVEGGSCDKFNCLSFRFLLKPNLATFVHLII